MTIPGFLPGQTFAVDEDLLHNNTFNVYVLDEEMPRIPQQMCDQHIKLAALDYPVILSTARHRYQPGWKGIPGARSHHLTPRHEDHPIVAWVGHSLANYIYLYELTCAIWTEFKFRFLDNAPYAKYKAMLGEGVPSGINGFSTKLTDAIPPPQLLPELYRVESTIERFRSWANLVFAYRDYYATEVYDFGIWTKRYAPAWLMQRDNEYARAHQDAMLTRNMQGILKF